MTLTCLPKKRPFSKDVRPSNQNLTDISWEAVDAMLRYPVRLGPETEGHLLSDTEWENKNRCFGNDRRFNGHSGDGTHTLNVELTGSLQPYRAAYSSRWELS